MISLFCKISVVGVTSWSTDLSGSAVWSELPQTHRSRFRRQTGVGPTESRRSHHPAENLQEEQVGGF